MPPVSALATLSLASFVKPRPPVRSTQRERAARAWEPEEQLFEPRTELGELLHALQGIQPFERG